MTPRRRWELDALAEAMRKPRACPILQALHIAGAVQGAAVTQEEMDELTAEVLGAEPDEVAT